jgi:hypothetical protein
LSVGDDSGQASVELVAGAAVIVVIALLLLQLLAAGYAAVMAEHAAEAGALGLTNGHPAAAAARKAVPEWPDAAMRVQVEGAAVRVTLVPPSPFEFVRRRLSVTARAVARRPAWDR